MKMVKLKRFGRPVWVNPEQVVSIREEEGYIVLDTTGDKYSVDGEIDEVMLKLGVEAVIPAGATSISPPVAMVTRVVLPEGRRLTVEAANCGRVYQAELEGINLGNALALVGRQLYLGADPVRRFWEMP